MLLLAYVKQLLVYPVFEYKNAKFPKYTAQASHNLSAYIMYMNTTCVYHMQNFAINMQSHASVCAVKTCNS